MPHYQKFASLFQPKCIKINLFIITVILLVTITSCANKPKIASSVQKNNTSAPITTVEPINYLDLGKAIEKELGGGQSNSFILFLEANQYINIVVEQKGIDIVAALYNPSNEKVYEVDSPNGEMGAEPIYFISQQIGSYRLEISSLDKNAKTGKYEAKIVEKRPSIPIDINRVVGFKAFQEGVLLQLEELEGKTERVKLIISKYETAIDNLDKAQELLPKAVAMNYLAGLYVRQGDYTKAEPLYIQALEIRKKLLGDNHPDTSNVMNNLGLLYVRQGDYTKAEPLYIQALEIRKKLLGDNHPDTITSLSSLAGLYYNKGNYTKAEPLLIQVVEIRKKALGENNYTVAIAIKDLGLLYEAKGDYTKAEPLLIQALDIMKKVVGESHPYTLDAMGSLATLYYSTNNYSRAEPLLLQTLEIRKKVLGKNNPDTITSLNNLAVFYEKKRDYTKAESIYIEALETTKQTVGNSHPSIITLLNNLGLLYIAKENYMKALQYIIEANNVREKEIARNLSIGSEKDRQIYLQQYNYETDISLSLHTQLLPKNAIASQSALTEILRRKGRSIDAVNKSIEALRDRSKPEDVNLLDELSQKKILLSNLTIQGLGKLSPESYKEKIKSLQDEIDKLEYKVSEKSIEINVQLQPITLQAIQQILPKNSTLIEFTSYRPYDFKARKSGKLHYLVYLLNSEGQPLWAELGEAATINSLVDELRKKLRSKQTSIEKEIKPLARRLDELIMRPVRKLGLATGVRKRLLIAPDGKLNLIPFAALVDEKGRYLVEDYQISYLTSGRDLLRLQMKTDSKQLPVIIGNPDFGELPSASNIKEGSTIFAHLGFKPLPSTELEAKAIKKLLPKAELLLEEQATEQSLNKLNAPLILHIATHGFFLKEEELQDPGQTTRIGEIIGTESEKVLANVKVENPLLLSGIALAGANLHNSDTNQGIFTALKATGLNLWGTKLVVLSACDTGVGEVKTGDGIYGLRRALVLAGSESQVMSLWPVSDDGTKELMVDYYKRLQKKEGRADALRNVQLELLKNPKRRHPFYWASFIQSGEWANLDGKR